MKIDVNIYHAIDGRGRTRAVEVRMEGSLSLPQDEFIDSRKVSSSLERLSLLMTEVMTEELTAALRSDDNGLTEPPAK